MKGTFFVAQRLFFSQRREKGQGHPLLGATLGIALALIPLVTVDHVADAMIGGIIARYRETSSSHLQVHPWGDPSREEWEEKENLLRNELGIVAAWTERQGFGLAQAGPNRGGLTLRALPPDLLSRDDRLGEYLLFDKGNWDLHSPDAIMLGREVARQLGLTLGDSLHILTGRQLPDGRYIPKVTPFRVTGIFSTGYQDLDRYWGIIPLETGSSILSSESSRSYLAAKVLDPNKEMALVLDSVSKLLPSDWIVYDWRELNQYLLDNLQSTHNILLLIMALIFLVALFNVVSSLIMLSLERRREIGILKCTGVSPQKITQIFFFSGMLAALMGTFLGLAGGLLVSYYVNEIIMGIELFLGFLNSLFSRGSPAPQLLNEGYYLQQIPISLRWKFTALIGFITLVLAAGAAAIPSARASRLKPLEVLRKH